MKQVLKSGRWQFRIDKGMLFITGGRKLIGRFRLSPLIEGVACKLAPWERVSSTHFKSAIRGGKGWVHLRGQYGKVCYYMETGLKEFGSLTYFPDSTPVGHAWQTYVSDEHDRLWDNMLDTEVLISSSYPGDNPDGSDGEGMCDPGDKPMTWVWNVPVRAMSFKTDTGWLGLSVPGALPVGVTRLKMERQRFSMTFQALRPSCRGGMMPKVYFAPGLTGAYDVLDTHRRLSEKMGLMRKKDPDHPKWWTYPRFLAWDELLRLHKESERKSKKPGAQWAPMTAKNLKMWIKTVGHSMGVTRRMNFLMEQMYIDRYGSRRVVSQLGGVGGFRRTIDELRKQGVHVGVYLHPFNVDKKENAFYRKHPEAFCRRKDRSVSIGFLPVIGAKSEFGYIDWTHPLGREYMLDLVEFLISPKKGCLNADRINIDNARGVDPRSFELHDPDWGIGDLMQMKVLRLIYEKVKEIKPHAMLQRLGVADCYMQPFADEVYCNEHWKPQPDDWHRRGQIVTRTMRDVAFATCGWFATMTKSYEYYMSVLVWSVPETLSVGHAIHPYMHYRPLQEKYYRRRRSGVQVYMNAPINITDRCRVSWHDNGTLEAWRKYTRGPLKGFYAALALSRRCFVTYNEKQALVGSSETRLVRIPLPPSARLMSVERVSHGRRAVPCEYRISRNGRKASLQMRIEDCGGNTMYYRIRYRISG